MHNNVIIFYINSLAHGGAERVIIQLAKHFSDAGYRAVIMTSYVADNEYPLPEKVERYYIDAEKNKGSLLSRNIRRIRAVRKKCRELRPDVLISFMGESNLRAIIATVGLKVKTIISIRNDPNIIYRGILGKFTAKFIFPFADGCVFQTEEAKKWFPKRLQKKSEIIFNEVDNSFFDAEYSGGSDIVAIGRIEEQKNFPLLIKAFAKISDDFPQNDLFIYGSGKLCENIKEYILQNEVESRVHMMGITDSVVSVLKNAALFVLSSDYEGLPNVLLEAVAVGVPCVATDCPCGGPRLIIENGVNGVLVPTGDADALANAMAEILSDSDAAKLLGKNAQKSAERFRPENVFMQWDEYVKTVSNR